MVTKEQVRADMVIIFHQLQQLEVVMASMKKKVNNFDTDESIATSVSKAHRDAEAARTCLINCHDKLAETIRNWK